MSYCNREPFLTNSPYGIAMVHNGNLTNFRELREELRVKDRIHCNSGSDTEALLGALAAELNRTPAGRNFFEALTASIGGVFKRAIGAYSVIGIIAGKGMFAFRDPHGIRPLVWGTRERSSGASDVVFSEEEIRRYIGCNLLLYQKIDDLVEAVTRKGEHSIDRLSMPYLDGWYVTGDLSRERIRMRENRRAAERARVRPN